MTVLSDSLRSLPLELVEDFCHEVEARMDALYREDVWAIAYIIHHGCSDDSFSDFRSCVITGGEELFSLAVNDAAAFGLAYDPEVACEDCDSLQYLGSEVYEERTGQRGPVRERPHPPFPLGERWEEDDLPELFPEVCERWA